MTAEPDRIEIGKEGWLKIELFSPAELSDALTNFLTEIGAQGSFQESPEPRLPNCFPNSYPRETLNAFLPCDASLKQQLDALQVYLDSLAELFPDLEKPGFRTELVSDPGWGEAWKKYFKPLRIGRNIVIKPTWERFNQTGNDVVIEIDPGMAFGTGQHASTRMCLEAIETILRENQPNAIRQVLDVGTGTGILGIACAKLGIERVLCVDNDTLATRIAGENVLLNKVESRVTVASQDIATMNESFPLIIANLTATILIELYPHFVRLISPGGIIVISGIIEQSRLDIEACFSEPFFSQQQLIIEKEWACYILKKGVDTIEHPPDLSPAEP
jgi:ribosomal protein L11 methyltransferase